MTDPLAGAPETADNLQVPWDDDPEDLYQHAPCGYLSMLPDGTIVKVNQTFLSWTGFDRSALVGRRRLRDLLTAGSRIYHETHYALLLPMQDAVHEIAFDVVCADGRRLPTLVTSVLDRDAAGNPRVIRTTIFNATERRSYERELMSARRAAEASEGRVRVLQQVVAELAAAPTEAQVAETVLRAPAAVFGATEACVWFVDLDRQLLVPAVATEAGDDGAADDHAPIPLRSSSAFARIARDGRLRVVGSVAEAQVDTPELAQLMLRHGCSSMLVLPLTAVTSSEGSAADASVLGMLAFGFADLRAFTDGELDVVRLLGHQAGQALHRARLYDDARRREQRATFLAETTRALDESHRLTSRAQQLVSRVVPEIAEWAGAYLSVGDSGIQVQAGTSAPEPDRLTGLIAAVVTTSEASFPGGDRGGDGADVPEAEVAVLPLRARGRLLGTLALRLPSGAATTAADVAFLNDLTDRAAQALENARLYEQERAIARTLQRSLLAGDLPADDRFAVDTHYQPATADLEVGGDWYDAFLISSDRLAVVIGDVVGRGIDAATTMGQLRSAIRALASAEAGPARLLERLDVFVERVETARMATVVYGEITLSTGELTFCCAGHLPPLLHEPGAAPRYLWGGRSAPLGSRAGDTARSEQRVTMAPGSRLLLFTDGLVERRTRLIDVGLRSLADEMDERRGTPLTGLAAGIVDDLVGPEHGDDVCVLCVSLGTETRIERRIPADPGQIALLRQDLRSWLASHDIDEESRQAVLLASSEAAANAIEHGYRGDPYGVVTIAATMGPDTIEVQVTDQGQWRSVAPGVSRGRGLTLMRQVMDEVTISSDAGTVVVMRRGRERTDG